jgi:hypothetical protein
MRREIGEDRTCLIEGSNRVTAFILRGKCSCVGDEPQKHGNLAFDVGLSIDVPYVSLDGAGLDAKASGDAAIPQSPANEFRYLTLSRGQLVPTLNIGPLFSVQQKDLIGFLVMNTLPGESFDR